MSHWKKTEDVKPLPDNVHGHKVCITYWPFLALDDDGDPTEEICGGVQHICWYTAVGNGGHFEDPDNADAHGSYFGDDYCYADQPSHWAECIPNPDGSDTSTEIQAIGGIPVPTEAEAP